MKVFKKNLALIMTVILTVSLTPASFAISYSKLGEYYKLLTPPIYSEYKLGSTVSGTLEPVDDTITEELTSLYEMKPEDIPFSRTYYFTLKEETAVEVNYSMPEESEMIMGSIASNGGFKLYELTPGKTKEVLEPDTYFITISNFSENPVNYTLSIKKTTLPTAKSIKFTNKKLTMSVGNVIKPDTINTPEKSVIKAKWSSSNKKVATVSKDGYITAKGLGSCTISAKIGSKTVKCTVNVTEETLYLKNKTSKTLAKPVGAKDKDIKWSSSNKKVATVSKKGKVTIKKLGDALIKAKVGKKTYKYNVTSYDFKELAKKAKMHLKKNNKNLKIKSVLCGFSPDTSTQKGYPNVFVYYTSDNTESKTHMLYVDITTWESISYTEIPYNISASKLKKVLSNVQTIKNL